MSEVRTKEESYWYGYRILWATELQRFGVEWDPTIRF